MLKALARLGAIACALLLGSAAMAQGVVQQAGTITAGDAVVWADNGQIMDGGASTVASTGSYNWPGKQVFGPSSVYGAAINIAPGATPLTPTNGDLWVTSLGLYAQINGAQVGPFMANGTTQTANTVFAAPNGYVGTASFRALVVADISNLGANIATALTTAANGTGAISLTTGPAFVSPNLGTPSAAVLSNATGLPLTTGVTGILPLASGGTNCSAASVTCVQNIAGSQAANAVLASPSGAAGVPTFRAINGLDLFGVVAAPVNLAPNSQWEIMSGWQTFSTQLNYQGTGTVGLIAATANTTGSVGRSTFTVTTTGFLSVGDLVQVQSGTGIDPCFTVGPMRVVALVANTSITLRTYQGCAPTVTHAENLLPVTAGAYGVTATGSGPDGWTKSASMPMWINYPRGLYVANMPTDVPAYDTLAMTKDIAGIEQFYINVPASQMAQYAGRTIVFGIEGYQKVRSGAGTWTVFEQDSTNAGQTLCGNAPTTGTFNWVECSYTVPATATSLYIGVQLQGATSDTYYFANPVLAIGSYIGGPRNYQKPRNEILVPQVHISPIGWINAGVTFPASVASFCGTLTVCFEQDAYAETGGSVAPTVVMAHGQLEGFDCGAVVASSALVRVMAWYDRATAPEKSGSFLPQYVACVKSFSYMALPFNNYAIDPVNNGTGIYVSGVASDFWQNVSLEYDWFILN